MKRVIRSREDILELSEIMQSRLIKNPKPFIAKLKAAPKTHEQLGYLHAAVLPVLTECLFEHGEIKRKNERDCKYWLKRNIGYGEWIGFDGGQVFDPSSFEAASEEELSAAIEAAIWEAGQRAYYIPPAKTTTKEQ